MHMNALHSSSSVEQSLCTITASSFEREAGGVTARSLTSMAWAVGKLQLSDKRLLAALTGVPRGCRGGAAGVPQGCRGGA